MRRRREEEEERNDQVSRRITNCKKINANSVEWKLEQMNVVASRMCPIFTTKDLFHDIPVVVAQKKRESFQITRTFRTNIYERGGARPLVEESYGRNPRTRSTIPGVFPPKNKPVCDCCECCECDCCECESCGCDVVCVCSPGNGGWGGRCEPRLVRRESWFAPSSESECRKRISETDIGTLSVDEAEGMVPVFALGSENG
jgi:hypothetical protein